MVSYIYACMARSNRIQCAIKINKSKNETKKKEKVGGVAGDGQSLNILHEI